MLESVGYFEEGMNTCNEAVKGIIQTIISVWILNCEQAFQRKAKNAKSRFYEYHRNWLKMNNKI